MRPFGHPRSLCRVTPLLLGAFLSLHFQLEISAQTLTSQKPRSVSELEKHWNKAPLDSGRTSAEKGDSTAMVFLGRAYRFGADVKQSSEEAVKWFRLASDKGDPNGTVNLGWMYGYDPSLKKDQTAAFELYLKAAQQGQLDAMYELYFSYSFGKGVAPNPDNASLWLNKAADSGHPGAQTERGFRLEFQSDYDASPQIIRPNNMPEAISWYRRAVAQDAPNACFRLGLCYLKGKGVEWDEEQGLTLIRKAADLGNLAALVKLAELYAQGIGEPRSEQDRPINLLWWAAAQNFPDAFEALVFWYSNGCGINCDFVEASHWYCQAAVLKRQRYPLPSASVFSPEAKLPSDPHQTALVLYLRTAINVQDTTSPALISRMYMEGREVPQDYRRAWAWSSIAAERGSAKAQAELPAIAANLSPSKVEIAQRIHSLLLVHLKSAASLVKSSSASPVKLEQ